MTGLLIAIKILLLCVALYSVLAYKSRRNDNGGALQRLRRAAVLRTLTPDETHALQPLRIANGLSWRDDVRALRGAYVRHGLDVNGNQTVHDTIGDVEVVLPYDAVAFLQPHNDAEVVITAKAAIVVRLNGFTVAQGRARSQQSPALAPVDPALPPPVPFTHPGHAVPVSEPVTSSPVEILEERKETQAEAALRRSGGLHWLLGGIWALALVLLLMAAWTDADGARVPLMVLALIAVAGAIFWQWRPRLGAIPPLRAVKRMQGRLSRIDLPHPTNASLRTEHYFLGDAHRVQLPAHWQQSGRIPLGQTLQMEVAITSGEVMDMGDAWSRADEARRFPDRGWGRHVVLLCVALLALLIYAMGSDGPAQDLSLAWQGLRSGESRSDASAASLLERPARSGDRVRLSGRGQCELALTAVEDTDAHIVLPDCSRIRWGGQPATLPDVQMPPALLSLYHGDYVREREDRTAMLRMLMLQQDAANNPYARAALGAQAEMHMMVSGLGNLVGTVEQACSAGMGDCDGLQREIVQQLGAQAEVDGEDVLLDTWPLLVRELRQAAEEGADRMQMSSQDLGDLRRATRLHAGRVIVQQLQQHTTALLSLQRGGVVLDTPTDLRQYPTTDLLSAVSITTVLQHWENAMTTQARSAPFAVQGLVVGSHQDDAGVRLQIDPSATHGRVMAAAASSLCVLLALGLLLVSTVLLWRGIVAAQARTRALEADMQARPVPGLVSPMPPDQNA